MQTRFAIFSIRHMQTARAPVSNASSRPSAWAPRTAVRVALEATGIDAGPVVVLNGDLPLIEPQTIRTFAESVADGEHAAAVSP